MRRQYVYTSKSDRTGSVRWCEVLLVQNLQYDCEDVLETGGEASPPGQYGSAQQGGGGIFYT